MRTTAQICRASTQPVYLIAINRPRAPQITDRDDKVYFSRCVEESMESLYGLALRLTRNNADAEDLVAESVTKAWAAFPTLQERDRFRPWVLRILHNCFISNFRKRSVRPAETAFDECADNNDDDSVVSLLLEQSDEYLHWWANPELELTNRLLGEDIIAAIESLPEVFRITVILINVEGLSYDEAAEVLGVPPGTVRSRMKRGRALLKKALWEQAKNAGLIPTDQMEERTA